MNILEQKMVDILVKGKNEYGYLGVKAEFEAEGTRVDELLRLIEIAHRAGVKLAVKIGGCEAIRDLLESKLYGVDYIIAPMIESVYALSKYAEARDKCYNEHDKYKTSFLFNIETQSAFNIREALAKTATSTKLSGFVFGRVDMTGSMGLSRDSINDQKITDMVKDVATLSKQHGLELVVGGGVSNESISALREIKAIHLTRFETRKIVFSGDAVDLLDLDKGLLNAVDFELSWLKNKQNYYRDIYKEDDKRINMLESRWKDLIQNAAA
jgi:hypothetical protein